MDSVFKLKEAKIYLEFLFSLCVLHPGRHPVCHATSGFVSGSDRAVVRDVRTHMSGGHVSVCQPAFVYMSTVCRVEAGALLSQAITFTSTPNLS